MAMTTEPQNPKKMTPLETAEQIAALTAIRTRPKEIILEGGGSFGEGITEVTSEVAEDSAEDEAVKKHREAFEKYQRRNGYRRSDSPTVKNPVYWEMRVADLDVFTIDLRPKRSRNAADARRWFRTKLSDEARRTLCDEERARNAADRKSRLHESKRLYCASAAQ